MAEEYNNNRVIGATKWWDSSTATTATASSLSTLQMMGPGPVDAIPGFRPMYGSDPKGFSLDQFSHTSSVDSCGGHGGLASPNMVPTESSPAPGMFQVFMEPPPLLQPSPGYGGYINQPPSNSDSFNWINTSSSSSAPPQFFRGSNNQLQQPQFFNNVVNGSYWDPVANSIDDVEARPALFFPVDPPVTGFHDKDNLKSATMAVKTSSTGAMRKSSLGSNRTSTAATASTTTSGGGAAKRSRNEASSAMPPFKVRKEKMGDRITALQQLVSPFGKTDTASVLSESIEYIKFLHEQVNVLSTPYLKSGASLQLQQQSHNISKDTKKDLRSRGLCLVPISSTFPVAHESAVDFWTPTFGSGTFR